MSSSYQSFSPDARILMGRYFLDEKICRLDHRHSNKVIGLNFQKIILEIPDVVDKPRKYFIFTDWSFII